MNNNLRDCFTKVIHRLQNVRVCFCHSVASKKSVSRRDVIVFDHNFKLKEWLSGFAPQQRSLRHPSIRHILGRYANCEYHRPYNYNNIGEFSLNISAGEHWYHSNKKDQSTHSHSSISKSPYHDVLIWPEALFLKNLLESDVDALYPYLSSDVLLNCDILKSLKAQLNPKSLIESIPQRNIQIIANVSKMYPLFRALQVLQWFHHAIVDSIKVHDNQFQFILGANFSEHRNATQILILPNDDCYQGILSNQQVNRIVEQWLN